MNKWSFLFVLAFVLTACSTQKATVKTRSKDTPNKNTRHIIAEMQKHALICGTMSLKSNIELSTEEKTRSFKANIRLRKDSAIWVSISPLLGIEAMRMLITKDTIKVINRVSADFFIGNFDYISEKWGIDLSFGLLQALIMGNGMDITSEEKPRAYGRKGHYMVSTFKKRKLKKAKKKSDKFNDIAHTMWLDPNTFKITKISVQDFGEKRSMVAEFEDFLPIEEEQYEEGGQLFARKTRLDIQADQTVKADISHSRVRLNRLLRFPFKIPEKYEQIY